MVISDEQIDDLLHRPDCLHPDDLDKDYWGRLASVAAYLKETYDVPFKDGVALALQYVRNMHLEDIRGELAYLADEVFYTPEDEDDEEW